jgi:hypothetical protein
MLPGQRGAGWQPAKTSQWRQVANLPHFFLGDLTFLVSLLRPFPSSVAAGGFVARRLPFLDLALFCCASVIHIGAFPGHPIPDFVGGEIQPACSGVLTLSSGQIAGLPDVQNTSGALVDVAIYARFSRNAPRRTADTHSARSNG